MIWVHRLLYSATGCSDVLKASIGNVHEHERHTCVNSFSPWEMWQWYVKIETSEHMFQIKIMSHCEIALRSMPQNTFDNKFDIDSGYGLVLSGNKHYLSQCWPRPVLLYGITGPQWVIAASMFRLGPIAAWVTEQERLWLRKILCGKLGHKELIRWVMWYLILNSNVWSANTHIWNQSKLKKLCEKKETKTCLDLVYSALWLLMAW